MDDDDDRLFELEAIREICGDDFYVNNHRTTATTKFNNDNEEFEYVLKIQTLLPEKGIQIMIRNDEEEKEETTIQFLPELLLKCIIKKGYPHSRNGDDVPSFEVNVLPGTPDWLRFHRLEMQNRMCELWQPGFPVIFAWREFLRNDLVSVIFSPNNFIWEMENRTEFDLVRALDARYWQVEFSNVNHKCTVCFSDVSGSDCCVVFPCRHFFCKTCTAQHVYTKITDGDVMKITCMQPKCPSIYYPNQISTLVNQETYERYERYLLQKTLETLGDVVYCPRCSTPAVSEGSDGCANCSQCDYVFCGRCLCPYHGDTSCTVYSQSASILNYTGPMTEKQQSQKVKAVQEAKSLDMIKQQFMRCPSCKQGVEKELGCNKMTCTCGTYFCYLCGADITVMKYEHYSAGGCAGRLFTLPQELMQDALDQAGGIFNRIRWRPIEPERPVGIALDIKSCPSCQAEIFRDPISKINNIRCWNCRTNFCFLCLCSLKKGSNHFTRGSNCPQHGDRIIPVQKSLTQNASATASATATAADDDHDDLMAKLEKPRKKPAERW